MATVTKYQRKALNKATQLANEYNQGMLDFIATQPSKSQIILHHDSLEKSLISQFDKINYVRSETVKASIKENLISKIRSLKEEFLTCINTPLPQSLDVKPCVLGKISFNKTGILGTGSRGTTVYEGTFEGRKVAVKKLIEHDENDMTKALNEINGLIKCDAHKNVVRYFGEEHQKGDFILLALEFCDLTLDKWIQAKGKSVSVTVSRKSVLEQSTEGLNYLHCLNIVHRDVKPQNILLRVDRRSKEIVVKISDFGICKILPEGRSSQTMTSGFGSEGWMAPEILRFLEERQSRPVEKLTPAADMFSLGCVFYYVLTWGKHPFGLPLRRTFSILENKRNLDDLEKQDKGLKFLLQTMTSKAIRKRPPPSALLQHHIFWSDEKIISFIVDISNRTKKKSVGCENCKNILEKKVKLITGNVTNWLPHLCPIMINYLENLPAKYGKYNGLAVMELIRLIRNMNSHISEEQVPVEVKKILGTSPSVFIGYWITRFPFLVPVTWSAFQSLKNLPEYGLGQYYPNTFHF